MSRLSTISSSSPARPPHRPRTSRPTRSPGSRSRWWSRERQAGASSNAPACWLGLGRSRSSQLLAVLPALLLAGRLLGCRRSLLAHARGLALALLGWAAPRDGLAGWCRGFSSTLPLIHGSLS